MISFRAFIRSTAALCAVMSAGMCLAEDGVVRMSDRSTETGAGVVRMGGIQQVGFRRQDSHGYAPCGEGCVIPNGGPQCCPPVCVPQCCPPVFQPCDPCQAGGYVMCDPCNGGGQYGSCYTPADCNHIFAGSDSTGMPSCWCSKCQCSPCQCRGRGDVTLFAHSVDSGTGSACRDWYHGQSMSFRNKNARLADRLFGWMIPSGCCGRGCPPVGKYHMTYADQPGYMDARDGQVYAAQGYGMPMTVPLAPNVNHQYNYSSSLPASRVTHIGNYNPSVYQPQRLGCQSW
ncbi:MAG: hypothetical protein ACK58L_15555 [Planctomycetota bacterium]